MKKKIFGLIAGLCCTASLFSGCNLFGTDYNKYYGEIVAKNGKYEVTREELINGYSSYGQELVSEQNYSTEEAMKATMKMLLQRKMLLDTIKNNAAKELANTSLETKDYKYELTNSEYNAAVKEAWEYIDGQIKTYVTKNYDDPDTVFTEDEKDDSAHAGSKDEFTQTIKVEDGKIKVVTEEKEDDESRLSIYNYAQPTFIDSEIVDKVMKEYIADLKEAESYKKPKDTSDKAVLNRELDRVFKTSLENAYLTKFQTSYTNSFGTENGYLTGSTTQAILDKYIAMYNANKEEYEIDSASFYKNVVDTSNRKNYVFYGYSEDIIEVHHILIKFANDSSEYEKDPLLSDEENEESKKNLNTINNTLAKERDSEGYETGKTVSVYDLRNTLIQNIIDYADGTYTRGSQAYTDYVTTEFDKLMYKYNEDDGILNAQFDYAIGANGTTSMVEPFTNAAIDLYNEGYTGAISDIVESSYGYHIILYTNKLSNVDLGAVDINLLASIKLTSSSTEENNMLEYMYSLVKSEAYSSYESNVLATLEAGQTYTYYKSVYKDLLG